MRDLWKLPDLWTRKRTRAHEVLGRRHTDAGAHSYHRPRRRVLTTATSTTALRQSASPAILTAARLEWPLFKRSDLAGFQRSVTPPMRTKALAVGSCL
jgi:hypothetical protein